VIGNLSLGCEVLTCTIEEHVMFSRACGWKHGHLLWSVSHKGEDGPKDIAAEGVLPPGYIPIRDRFISEQEAEGGSEADVDCLFEIPIALVQSLTGFRPDEASPAFEEGGFELLESSRKPWFQRIFSK